MADLSSLTIKGCRPKKALMAYAQAKRAFKWSF
jgi:hypothetical protein